MFDIEFDEAGTNESPKGGGIDGKFAEENAVTACGEQGAKFGKITSHSLQAPDNRVTSLQQTREYIYARFPRNFTVTIFIPTL